VRKVLLYIVIFCFGIALGYYLFLNKDNFTIKNEIVDNAQLSSHSVLVERKQDFIQSAPKMLGESIIINGVVKEAYKNRNNEMVLYIEDTDIPIEINCTLSNSDRQIQEPIRFGEAINLQGIFTQLNEQMYLEGCRLIYRAPLER
jgi:hypothetical protein